MYYRIDLPNGVEICVQPSGEYELSTLKAVLDMARQYFPVRKEEGSIKKSEQSTAAATSQVIKPEIKVSPEEILKAEELGVIERDGCVMVGSRAVAKAYEKQHAHILEAIRRLECSEKFRASNFRLANYKDARQHLRPEYFMTRDGFVFLVMGFTGKLAAKFKEAYINAFNAMEAALKARQISA